MDAETARVLSKGLAPILGLLTVSAAAWAWRRWGRDRWRSFAGPSFTVGEGFRAVLLGWLGLVAAVALAGWLGGEFRWEPFILILVGPVWMRWRKWKRWRASYQGSSG